MHDERHYPEPEKFKPERFLSTNTEKDQTSIAQNGNGVLADLSAIANDPTAIVFGFGRRLVQGLSPNMSPASTDELILSESARGAITQTHHYGKSWHALSPPLISFPRLTRSRGRRFCKYLSSQAELHREHFTACGCWYF
jgi:hypothetical protein